MVRRKRIRSIVEDLLRECKINAPPVDVRRVAKHLRLKVKEADTDDDMSGFLRRATTTRPAIIGVNSNHALNRRRFTVAHEIGHFLLHAASEFHVDGTFAAYRRDGRSAEGTDWVEVEANAFAAELLMPHTFLVEDLENVQAIDLEDESEVAGLAKRYGVSQQAMTFRLANLDYLQL